MRRVALIFDDRPRPETTAGYCLRALGHLAEVVHLRPGDWETLPPHAFDLYLAVDDGLDYPLPGDRHPLAWWAIDTHIDFPRALARALYGTGSRSRPRPLPRRRTAHESSERV